ncbi:MAG: 2-oxo acid dehydrogenase subunit E2 [Candidatus Berkiellales bacterium]
MNIKEITVPDIGNFSGVEVIEVAITPGAVIKAEDTLVTLETEKAAMDVPSPVSGKVKEVKLKAGDKVSKGDLIALVELTQEPIVAPAKPEAPAKAEEKAPAKTPAPSAAAAPIKQTISKIEKEDLEDDDEDVHAGPATRRLARELGVDLSKIHGSGPKNRVVTNDIHAYVKSALQSGGGAGLAIESAPAIDFSQFGAIEVKPLSRIKKWTAKNLHRNWVSIPHVTQFDEADITDLEHFRQENRAAAEKQGIRLTLLAFIMKAVVAALKAYPQVNASLAPNGTELIYKKYFHLGVAVDTADGLMVPVLRDVDLKGIYAIAQELAQLSSLAREGKLKNEQMQGSCFSITSLGGVGGTSFTPIINAPDVAILGVSKSQTKPIFLEGEFVPRLMLPLSLSYDHRVIDGAEGARFLNYVVDQLQDIRKLLL